MNPSSPNLSSLSELVDFSYSNPATPKLPQSYGPRFIRWIVERAYSLWDYLHPGSVAKARFVFDQVIKTAHASASNNCKALIEHLVCHLTRKKIEKKEGLLYAKKTVEAIEKRGFTDPLLSKRIYSNYLFISQDPDLKSKAKLYSLLPILLSNEQCAKKMEQLDLVARKKFYLAAAARSQLSQNELLLLLESLSLPTAPPSSKETAKSQQEEDSALGEFLAPKSLYELESAKPRSLDQLIPLVLREEPSPELIVGAQLSPEEQESLRRIRRNLELNTTSATEIDELTPQASREFYLAAIALRLDQHEGAHFETLALFLSQRTSRLRPNLPSSTTPNEALRLLGKRVFPQIEKESKEDQYYFYELLLPKLWSSIELIESSFENYLFHPPLYLSLVALRPSTDHRQPLAHFALKLAQCSLTSSDRTVEGSLKSLWETFHLSTVSLDLPFQREQTNRALRAAISTFTTVEERFRLPQCLAKMESHQQSAFLEVVAKLEAPLYPKGYPTSIIPHLIDPALSYAYLTHLEKPLSGEELEHWLIKQRLRLHKELCRGKGEVGDIWTKEFALFWYLANSDSCLRAIRGTTLTTEDQEQLLLVIRTSLGLSNERWSAFIRQPNNWHNFWTDLIDLDRYCADHGSSSKPLSYHQAWSRLFSREVPCPDDLSPQNLVHHLAEAFKKIETLEISK